MKSSGLPLAKRIRLRLFGKVYLEHRQPEGFSAPEPFYLVSCSKCGLFEDYPQGFEGKLRCPKCGRYTFAGAE